MTIMYDGIAADVAAIHAHAPRNPVACYVNGEFAWSPVEEAMFARKIRISVEPGQPGAAKYARVIDVERGAARPVDAAPFLRVRQQVGGNNGTVYCSLANTPAVLDAIGDLRPRWWLAWYWGRPGAPSASQVLAELEHLTGRTVPAADLWACQYVSHSQWDQSIVYGTQDWSR